MRNRIILILTLLLSVLNPVLAQDSDMTANERQAKRIFNQAYQQVFGEQGAKLHYDVNIIGIYKTSGTIWFKGKKKKKKEVEVRSAKNNKQDKYSGKFKFLPENFDYSVANDEEGLMLTLKAKKGAKGIKEVHALVKRQTYEPIRVRIKISIIWTTIKISDFQSGDITDEMLSFPKEQYKDYKFVDKR